MVTPTIRHPLLSPSPTFDHSSWRGHPSSLRCRARALARCGHPRGRSRESGLNVPVPTRSARYTRSVAAGSMRAARCVGTNAARKPAAARIGAAAATAAGSVGSVSYRKLLNHSGDADLEDAGGIGTQSRRPGPQIRRVVAEAPTPELPGERCCIAQRAISGFQPSRRHLQGARHRHAGEGPPPGSSPGGPPARAMLAT